MPPILNFLVMTIRDNYSSIKPRITDRGLSLLIREKADLRVLVVRGYKSIFQITTETLKALERRAENNDRIKYYAYLDERCLSRGGQCYAFNQSSKGGPPNLYIYFYPDYHSEIDSDTSI